MVFSRFSTQDLALVAAVGGVCTLAAHYMLISHLNAKVSQFDFYQDAFAMLRKHECVQHLLGSPIVAGKIDFTNKDENFMNSTKARFTIPVAGPKGHGYFYISGISALNTTSKNSWVLQACELGLHSTSVLSEAEFKNKRLIVFAMK